VSVKTKVASKINVTVDDKKLSAAQAAVEKYVQSGMKIGLGTGSTADHFTRALAKKAKGDPSIVCIPTSRATAELAKAEGLTLSTLNDHPYLDYVFDGADEIDPEFRLIKGGGGALLLEKIVATSSKFVVTIADESKLVEKLGKFPLPVEVVPWGMRATAWKMERAFQQAGMVPKMTVRMKDGKPFRTEAGNCIIDCACGEIREPSRIELMLNTLPGVVNNGLFINISGIVMVGTTNGVEELRRG
jgi:ribose 5-phosphate isomerase A